MKERQFTLNDGIRIDIFRGEACAWVVRATRRLLDDSTIYSRKEVYNDKGWTNKLRAAKWVRDNLREFLQEEE